MTTFEDGPAKGQHLTLRRTPLLLRVTECDGNWDALNELVDRPAANEKLHAYVLKSNYGSAFIDGTKFRGRVEIASYRHIATGAPSNAEMRDEDLWHMWCVKNDPRN